MTPKRKRNRLTDFDYSQPGAYFITVCVKDRKPMLGTVVGADDHIGPYTKLSVIGKVVKKYTDAIPEIADYVIMPNHVHMILRISATNILEGPMWSSTPTNATVTQMLRTWKTLITKEIGESIWQRSYYDHIIRNEADYIAVRRYIENNPAKWCEDKYYPGY